MTEDKKPTNADLLNAITKLNKDMNKGFAEVKKQMKDEFEAIDDRFNDLEFKLNIGKNIDQERLYNSISGIDTEEGE